MYSTSPTPPKKNKSIPNHPQSTVSKVSGLNGSNLNMRGLRDPSKCAHLLSELSNLSVGVAAVQETQFTCAADFQVLENDYVILSAYGSIGVSLLIGHSLNADVNLVLADDGSQLVVADVAIKSLEFRVAMVYAPNIAAERVSFLQWLAPFLDDPKQIVLVGDWNAIVDLKIDRVGRRA